MGLVHRYTTRLVGESVLYPTEQRLLPPAPFPGRSPCLGSRLGRTGFSPLVSLDYWHLLSLDAPTVAAVWMVFISHEAGLRSNGSMVTALFLGVWLLYAGDRLLDARPLAADPSRPPGSVEDLELRHFFHYHHRRAFLAVFTATLPVLAFLVCRIAPGVLRGEAALAGLLAGWLLLIHKPGATGGPRRLPKEFAVGAFFGAAVCLPAFLAKTRPWPALVPGAGLFCCVCTLNCLFLYAWEHPTDRSRAHPMTQWAVRHVQWLGVATLVAGLTAVLAAVLSPGLLPAGSAAAYRPVSMPLASVLSAALLLTLDTWHRRVSPLRLRSLADLVLLTPVLFAVHSW